MITLQDAVSALKNLAELAEAGNLGQVSSKGQDLLDAIDQAIRPMYPIYKTGSRSAPRPVYGWDYESYAAARPHLLDAKVGDAQTRSVQFGLRRASSLAR